MSNRPYTPHDWVTGELITAGKMNNIEQALKDLDADVYSDEGSIIERIDQIVKVSEEQPYSGYNKVWAKPSSEDGYAVPTETELQDFINTVAQPFSPSQVYNIGEYVIYDGTGTRKLYKFKLVHAAGTWNWAHVDEVVLGDEVSNIPRTAYDQIQAIIAASNEEIAAIENKGIETRDSIPDDYITLSDEVTDLKAATGEYKTTILSSCDLDSIITNVSWILDDSQSYTNTPPYQVAGFLNARKLSGFVLQTFITINGKQLYVRRRNASNVWSDWMLIGESLFFQTSETHDTTPFHFSDMPDNSHTYCVASRFADKPSGIAGTDYVYIKKSNMTSIATRSLFMVYDLTTGIWWTCATNSGSIDSNGWKNDISYYNTAALASCNLNGVLEIGVWLLLDSNTYTNMPPLQTSGFLDVEKAGSYVLQTFTAFSARMVYVRRGNSTGSTWTDWLKVGGGEFFQTSSSHETNPFHFSDMPENSYTYCVASRFADKPSGITSTDHLYITKHNMTSLSTRSLFQLYDLETGIWWTCATNNGSIDSNGWKRSGNINEYTFNTTNVSNTITATPEITTDNHNYLASTGDTTDRTSDINTLLLTGCCHLGPGDFYITGIDLPNNAELIGSGMSTRLILASSVTSGYAIKLSNISTVKDLRIKRPADITLPDTIGDVHGIVFLGTQTPTDSSQPTTYAPTIDNVNIRSFSGGGITCRGTGYNYATSLNVTNVVITNCFAGINIPYFSEFNRFTNVNVYACKFGCINNGGNNVFSCCGFNGNNCGILMDDSNGQSPNNSHGSYVGCTINHSGGNTGKALDLKGLEAGEVFVGCQIFYGSINIDNCNGIRFSSINTGSNCPINVTNSSAIIFSDMQVKEISAMPLTQSNNTTLKFINCYDRAGNVYDPMAS